MAIWPSCESASGIASLTVSVSSVRQTLLSAGACAPAAETARGIVMARNIVSATLMESDDFV